MSNASYELKDRVSCPPGGFVYRQKNGLKSMMMPHVQGSVDMCRQEYQIGSDDAMQMVLGDTYMNMPASAREYFITKNTEGLVYQNRTFRYVDKNFLTDGEYFYNPGLIEYEGSDHLIYRRQLANSDSTIWRFNFTTHTNDRIVLPEIYENEQFEDPRVFMHDGDIHCVFSSWRKNWLYKPKLRLVRLDGKWNFKSEIPLTFGGNGGGTMQKNWQFFSREGKLHFIYFYAPWQIVEGENIHLGKDLRWDYGELRGGTPPVLVNGSYYTFFHSRMDAGRARYYTGCVMFDGEPPFKPLAMTPHPLLTATNKEPNLRWAPLVTFPCGSLYRDGRFIVSLGINDLNCGLVDFTMDDLQALLRPI